MYKIYLIIISDLVDIIIFRRPIIIVLFPFNIHVTSVLFSRLCLYVSYLGLITFYVYNSPVSSQSAKGRMIGKCEQ
jgi:hypothetical protein